MKNPCGGYWGKVLWIYLTEGDTSVEEFDERFARKYLGGPGCLSHQHNPTVTPEGTLLVFDNGTHHPLQGRFRVIEVDFATREIVWQYVGSPVFSMLSLHIAGAERLPNGNTLICEGESGRILEVTRRGRICWEWISPFVHNFKGIPSGMLFRAHRYGADGIELIDRELDAATYEELNRKWGLSPG